MLDMKMIRSNPEEVKRRLAKRGGRYSIDEVLALDEKRRQVIVTAEELKAQKNKVSEEVAKKKKSGEDATGMIEEMRKVSETIKVQDDEIKSLDEQIQQLLLAIPNLPDESVPAGKDDTENKEIRRWGEPTVFDYEPKAHWDIGTDLRILDFEMGAKITGSRFTFYRGLGARLERACVNFFLNSHIEKGYTEMFTPFIANEDTLRGTGQLPKFAEDMFHLEGTNYYMIPTSEVTMTNMYRESVIDGELLPLRFTAYSACFRSEAGSAGRDTRGLVRQHQFNKVEMVKFAKPEQSYDELEEMTAEAERMLQLLGLPYRVVALCGGDLGFSAAKTYDIEVWMPSYNRYVEISSCSNCEDFQARRADIKFRPAPKEKTQLAHTLNGSGLAVGRSVAAILENYQQPDGTVLVPEVLRPYMGVEKITKEKI